MVVKTRKRSRGGKQHKGVVVTEKHDVIAKVEIPLCINDETLHRPGLLLGWNSARAKRYTDAVVTEIEANAGQFDDCRVVAVRLGGGVASNAGAGIADIMRALRHVCEVADDVLITMRASIANISGATMPFFRRARVSRFDFEMLSLNPMDFARINHVDNLDDFPIICDNFLHSYANDSLGLVLAYGFAAPAGQDGVLNVRRSALAAARTHTSHVCLERCAGEKAVDDDTADKQLETMREVLLEAGMREYLPLHFAREGKEDTFDILCARGTDCIGFGLGALTRLDGAESENTHDFERYCQNSHDFAAITEQVRTYA